MSSALPQRRIRVQRIAEAAVERARLTVVPRTRRVRAARVPFVTLVSLLLVGGVVGLLMFNTSMQQTSFTVSELEAEAAVLQSRQQTLEMELDRLRDPQRLGVWARKHGMVQPQSPAFLLMDGTVLGQPTPAVPDDGSGFDPSTPRADLPAELRQPPIIVDAKPEKKPEKKKDKQNDQRTGGSEGAGDGGNAGEPDRNAGR